jgi:hypothetical protein
MNELTADQEKYLTDRLSRPNGLHPKVMPLSPPFDTLDMQLRSFTRDAHPVQRSEAIRAIYRHTLKGKMFYTSWNDEDWVECFESDTDSTRRNSVRQVFLALVFHITGRVLWQLLPSEKKIMAEKLARRLFGSIFDESTKRVIDSLVELGYAEASHAGVLAQMPAALAEMVLAAGEPDITRWTADTLATLGTHHRSNRFRKQIHASSVMRHEDYRIPDQVPRTVRLCSGRQA